MNPNASRRMRVPEKSKRGISGVLRELFSYSSALKLPMIVSLVFAAGGAVLTIIGPDVLSQITDLISNSLGSEIDLAVIGRLGTILLVLYACSALLTYLEHFIMATVTLGLSRDLRQDLSRKINRVPMSYFSRVSFGELLSRVTNDVSTLQQALANSLPSMISSATQFVGCLVMMFATEWRMALAAILVTALGFALMSLVMRHSQKFFIDRQVGLSTLNGYVEEMYSGHEVVRLSRANRKVKQTFGEMNRKLYDAEWSSQFFSGVMQPLMNIIGNLGYVAVCVLGALAMSGQISFGVIIAFILYVRLFTSPLSTLAQGMTQMQTAAAAGDHVLISSTRRKWTAKKESGKRPNRSAERWSLSMSASVTRIILKKQSSVIFPLTSRPARKWPLWAPQAPAKQRWSTCSCAFLRSTGAPSKSTVSPQAR